MQNVNGVNDTLKIIGLIKSQKIPVECTGIMV